MAAFPEIQAKDFESFKKEFIIKLRHYLNNLKAENIISVDASIIIAGLALGLTTGLVVKNAAGTFTVRAIATNKAYITITDGDGVSGNPTIDIEYADGSTDGILKKGDWTTFNNKLSGSGVNGTFTTADGKTVTVSNGLIASIV